MDVDQNSYSSINQPIIESEAVRKIFCGGDQSFALVTTDQVSHILWFDNVKYLPLSLIIINDVRWFNQAQNR